MLPLASALIRLDLAAQAWVVGHRVAALDPIMAALGTAGRAGTIWIVLASCYVIVRRLSVRDWLRVTLAVLIAGLTATAILKPIAGRPRPFTRVPHALVIGERPADTSMPSGHAATSFAGALALSLVLPGSRFVFAALALAIAYSRVYVGVHYPLDVLAGAAVGLSATLTVWRVGTTARAAPRGVYFRGRTARSNVRRVNSATLAVMAISVGSRSMLLAP